MKKIVIKFGGSVLYKDNMDLNIERIQEIVDAIIKLHDEGYKIAVVVGGGKLARVIIQASDVLGHVATFKDILAVESTRIHALLVIASLNNRAYLLVPRTFEDVGKALSTDKIVVTGGLQPGQSTSAVAALVAEYWGADLLINLTNVDKVFDKDPKKHSDAIALDRVTPEEFLDIISKQEEEPGQYALFDKVGSEIIKRSRLKVVFANGEDPSNIFKAVRGESIGTLVSD